MAPAAATQVAGPDLKPGAGLSDYLELAALNNPGLKASYENWQGKLQKAPQVRALPNPTLNYSYFIREVETRVGPQRQKIGLMQMFPWFGKLKLKGTAASHAAGAAKQQYENTKLRLFYRVKEAYYDYYFISKTVSVLTENVQLLEYLEEVLRTRYRAGAAEYSALLKIQVELERLKDRLASTKDRYRPVKARLNAALNRPVNGALPQPPKDIPADSPGVSYSVLAGRLKQNNPLLKAADAMTAKEQAGIKLAKKNYYPDFALGVDMVLTGDASMPGVPDSGKDPVMAMLSVRLPIWGKKNKAAVNEATARYRSALNRGQETENKLLTRLEGVYYRFKDARRKAGLYKNSLLPRARQAMEVSRSAFAAGKMSFIDFIDSQRTLLMFQLEWENAKTRQRQRLAELEMLTGKTISLGE
jgi:outer membrane protein TolC